MSSRSLFESLRKMSRLRGKAEKRWWRRNYKSLRNPGSEDYKILKDDALRTWDDLSNASSPCAHMPSGPERNACFSVIASEEPLNVKGGKQAIERINQIEKNIELDPLLYVDDENAVIRHRARKLINGD